MKQMGKKIKQKNHENGNEILPLSFRIVQLAKWIRVYDKVA